MTKKQLVLGIVALFIIVAVALGFIFRDSLGAIIGNSFPGVVAKDVGKEIFSAPLQKLDGDSSSTPLTQEGVISLTNYERTQNNASTLKENTELDLAAKNKLDDLFAKQYFEHVSPSGVGPGEVANNAGYQYILEGENLALGNFDGNQDLINAWMASPGHRANILNTHFQDIGVAVGEGKYQGRDVWIAVQEFGDPLSQCPVVDASLKAQIDTNEESVDAMNNNLTAEKQAISTMAQDNQQDEDEYKQEVNEYNDLVNTFNTTELNLRSEITTYNNEVVAFNNCIGQ